MLVQFRSPATETITMFGNDAVQLLKLMGATGRVPGGLSGEDVSAAQQRLESAIEELKAKTNADTAARPADNEDWASDEDKDLHRAPPIQLETRAIPLLSVLKRAAAAKATVTWEAAR
ncbi:MAG TPA: DUF1840 domain-containing protein [Steroidobacteraceae bacterium]|nr:DUF1840 domain-containing protein [Steroidobacteraceae bacterium]